MRIILFGSLLISFASTLAPARADIEVLLSVKFITNNDGPGTRPSGAIGNSTGFATEVAIGNAVLAATGRGYSLKVVEYLDIQPPAPTGAAVNVTGGIAMGTAMVTCSITTGLEDCMSVQGTGIPANTVILSINPNVSFTMSANATNSSSSAAISATYPADFWFNLPARAKRQYIETTALAQAVWLWNGGAINIYVNNSGSGQCSFVGSGLSISLGSTAVAGTMLHEVGHFFDLKHTHNGDYPGQPGFNNPTFEYSEAHLTDGDGLDDTAKDNPNITNRNQLCQALFTKNYNGATTTDAERAVVDSAFQNVMSYHTEVVLLSAQMDKWTLNANAARLPFCSGRTWFIANGGNDGASGAEAEMPLATVFSGLLHVSTANDVVLLRNGSYAVPAGGFLSTPCTLRATRGDVTLHLP